MKRNTAWTTPVKLEKSANNNTESIWSPNETRRPTKFASIDSGKRTSHIYLKLYPYNRSEYKKAFQFYWRKRRVTCHTHKKKHRLYFVFFCVTCHLIIIIGSSGHRVIGSSTEGGIREWAISAAHVASLVVVVDARVTHQRESAGEARVSREVRAVIKSGITRDAQAVFVFVEFLHALFLRKFEPGFVGLRRLNSRRRRHAGGSSSSSPVAGSNMLGHRSSFVFVSKSGRYHLANRRKSISILFSRLGKSADHDKNRKMWGWSHVTEKKYTLPCVFCHMSHTHNHIYLPRTSLRSANIIVTSHFSFISRMPEGLASFLRTPIALRAA